jgi:hypothetical protein
MTTVPTPATAPPLPPGTLTTPASGPQVLAFLEALRDWTRDLDAALDDVDASAQLATAPDAYTPEITLAMSMRQSIDLRNQELVKAYDSGRVGPDQLAAIAQLLWGRLPDALGAPTPFTLSEACTLLTALVERLRAALSSDAIGGSGVASRILAVRSSIERCRRQVDVLGVDGDALEAQAATLERALASEVRDEIRTTVDAVDDAVAAIERDLIKEASARASTARRIAECGAQYEQLVARTPVVSELAERCRSRIVAPPQLAVPDVTVVGRPPRVPATDADAAQWEATRRALDDYAPRLERVARALHEAEEAYGTPLRTRDDLRGLLGAYRTRAARRGRAEDPEITQAYRAARTVLWSAPCDLVQAAQLVAAYQHAVRVGVGADPREEDEG